MRLRPARLTLQRLESRTVPALVLWDGGGADANWSTAENWVGDAAPSAGDDLEFPAGAAQLTNTNDFAGGTAFNSIAFTGGGYAIGGSAITLAAGISDDAVTGDNQLDLDLILIASQTFSITSETRRLTLGGTIGQDGGSFGVTKAGAGILQFAGSEPNSYDNTTLVSAGTLELNKTAGVTAINATLVIGDDDGIDVVRHLADDQIDDVGNVVVVAGGRFDLNGFSDEIHELQLRTNTSDSGRVATGGGTLTVGSTVKVFVDGDGATGASINGNLNLGGFTRTFDIEDGEAAVDLDLAAAILGLDEEGLIKAGAGTLRLSGSESNAYAGTTIVNDGVLLLAKDGATAVPGELVVNGGTVAAEFADQIADDAVVTVNDGATFDLNGQIETVGTINSVGGIVMTNGGDLAATNAGFNANSIVRMNLGDVESDLIAVSQSLNLGGIIQLSLAEPVAVGTEIVIIENTGPSSTIGQFSNFPDGSLQNVGGTTFQISYSGGIGANDVVITAVTPSAGQISGVVFTDINGNGVNNGDPGLDGVTVQLDIGADGSIDQTTVTAGGGFYTFGSLVPGDYRIRIIVPGGSIQTTANPADIPLETGQIVSDVDFGVFQLISVSGFKFNDANGDGVQNNGEQGVGGVTITLTNLTTGGPPASTTTNPDGTFTFTNVGPGSYQVLEVLPPGTQQTTPNPPEFAAHSGVNVGGIVFGNVAIGKTTLFAVAAGQGGGPHVNVYNADGSLRFSFFAYDAAFLGGVRVATGDVTGDGIDDIITAAGMGGGPHVKVFDGDNLNVVYSFMAYSPNFTGGVFVAVGDVNDDGFADIITGAGQGGGPHVEVFSGADLSLLHSFFAYAANFTGGVRVGAGDVDGDEFADIITGAGPGGGPHVQVFGGTNLGLLQSIIAFEPTFTGGVYVAGGDMNGDGKADVIVGAGETGLPQVRVFNALNSIVLRNFFAYNPQFRGGVRVAAADLNGDGLADIITGAGPGGGPHVIAFNPIDLVPIESFLAFDPAFIGGVYVG